MMSLTRRYHFAASHRLDVPQLGEAENRRLFGKCNNPHGHGHDYTLSVTVTGEPDKDTGLMVEVDLLDRLVSESVLRLLAHRNLNLDVPQFSELVPTTENVALLIVDLLEGAWVDYLGADTTARLLKVHVQETDRNGFEVKSNALQQKLSPLHRQESITVNG